MLAWRCPSSRSRRLIQALSIRAVSQPNLAAGDELSSAFVHSLLVNSWAKNARILELACANDDDEECDE